MTKSPLRIATRASALARWQAEWVAEQLRAVSEGREVVLVPITTTGDRSAASSLAGLGTQGIFTREIQQAVLAGQADVAVHSLKDLPTQPVEGLTVAAVPPRGPTEDVLVLPSRRTAGRDGAASEAQQGSDPAKQQDADDPADSLTRRLADLPLAARIGTGSLRRRAQLLWLRRDLVMADVRGNVDTRLRKLDEERYHALVLARAGLTRLGLEHRIAFAFPPNAMLPAIGQGAIGIECRSEDSETAEWLRRIDDPASHSAVLAERALLATLHGGCQAPIGALACLDEDRLILRAAVLSPDGTRRLTAMGTLPMASVLRPPPATPESPPSALRPPPSSPNWAALQSQAESLGHQVAQDLLNQGAASLIALARGIATATADEP